MQTDGVDEHDERCCFGEWAAADARRARSGKRVRGISRDLVEAERAGATIGRPGAETFWGGYSGVFIDPDGHPWEVAHNPFWAISDDGAIVLPPPG